MMTSGTPSLVLAPWLLQSFAQLIAERTGLDILSADSTAVCEKIWARTQATQQLFPAQYYQLLTGKAGEQRAAAETEWPQLIESLTNPESYFFRDRGQISVLKHHILPELIMRKSAERKITVCSAGCSRGEEAYSIAILLSELIPHIEDWDVTVLGVDINTASIAYAQKGCYRQWSLRGVSNRQQQLYFQQQKQHYCIDAKFREMVTFHALNLVGDLYPADMTGLDLIICRNVFIYFDAAAIATVIRKFHQRLQPQGYLLTGHAELYGQDTRLFQTQSFPGSLVFQRPATDAIRTVSNATVSNADAKRIDSEQDNPGQDNPEQDNSEQNTSEQDSSALESSERIVSENDLRQAYLSFRNQNFEQALQQVEAALEKNTQNGEALCLMARAYLGMEQFQLAADACSRALEVDEENLEPHYILAKIAIAQNELTTAKRILRKIIYLDANAVAAYLELSQLYQQAGNLKKSDRLRQLAFDIFKQQR